MKTNYIVITIIWAVLFILFLALAWKEPFKLTNSIANLDPNPDTLYYSIPAWNFVHGQGFKMAAYGKEIIAGVPPLYGIFLVPFFSIFNDVRSFYYANLLLMAGSIFVFLLIVEKIFYKCGSKYWLMVFLGFVLVTNFYVYNLPQLLMAENPLLLLTLISFYLLLLSFSLRNLILITIIGGLLWLTKLSAFPVIMVLFFWTLINFISSGYYKKIEKRVLIVLLLLFGGVLGLVIVKIIWKCC